MSSEVQRLRVFLNEVSVGELRYEAETATFRMSDEYIELLERPVLGQMFEDNLRATHRVRAGVPAWFSNLLPEGPLRELIAERAGVHPSREFFLLGQVGEDLPGAVRVIAESEEDLIDSGQLSEGFRATDRDNVGDFDFKFSLAGVQLKFSVLQSERGLTLPLHGEGGNVIAKLPDSRFPMVPENEYSMMTWARQSGINVPEIKLVKVSDIARLPAEVAASNDQALVIKRFDRDGHRRIHIEDFAQILNRFPTPKGKYGGANYETVASLVYNLAGRNDLDELVRRLVAITAMGNGDAHLKNFSVIYRDRVHPQLSPAYDLVSTLTYVDRRETLALNLAGSKDFDNVSLLSFRRMAKRLGLSSESDLDDVVLATVESLQAAWLELRGELPLAQEVRVSIDQRMRDLPLFSPQGSGGVR